jgi:Protein of unknown function (DUF2510)
MASHTIGIMQRRFIWLSIAWALLLITVFVDVYVQFSDVWGIFLLTLGTVVLFSASAVSLMNIRIRRAELHMEEAAGVTLNMFEEQERTSAAARPESPADQMTSRLNAAKEILDHSRDAGWYPDPDNPARTRWWDGYQWSNRFWQYGVQDR